MYKVTPEVKPQNQPTTSTCWLSCFQMLFQWKIDKGDSSKKADRNSILEAIDKSPILFPDIMLKNGIDISECKEAAKMLGMSWAGGGGGSIDAKVLEDSLRLHGPYWVAGNWGRGSHVIVVTGCSADRGTIKYINPWMNHSLTDSDGTISWLNNRGDAWNNCDGSLIYWR